MTMKFNTIDEIISDLQAAKPVIVLDDHDRENEGDLLVSAQFAEPEIINFMARQARGLICIAMTGKVLDRLGIPMMVSGKENGTRYGSPFTVSVEAKTGVTTGISAHDRSRTIKTLVDATSTPDDIVMPGHVFPLRAHPQRVLARRGHTEAGIDLMMLSGLAPAAVVCEILDDDGSMARRPRLSEFAREHGLRTISIEDIVQYRLRHTAEEAVTRVDAAVLPTRFGDFNVTAYRDRDNNEHLFLSHGHRQTDSPLVRVHSECLTGDVLGSIRCDCGEQLHSALASIVDEGEGYLVYLRQEGRGIGLINKIRAYALQDEGLDTVDANVCLGFSPDERSYAVAAAILRDQEISSVRLMTNNPDKVSDLEANQVRVVERIPLRVESSPENKRYLKTKAKKLDHLFVEDL